MERQVRCVKVSLSGPLNLKASLECGQAFRWKKAEFPGHPEIPIAYRGVIGSLAVAVGQTAPVTREILVGWEVVPAGGGQASREAAGNRAAGAPSESEVRDLMLRYFSDRDDVEKIERDLSARDGVMAEAVPHGTGLRILTQDPWECLASYVLSQNNSIPNISTIVERLSQCYGEPVGMGRYSFPDPLTVARQEVSGLRESKCGFRDKYLHDAASKVVSGDVDLAALASMPTGEARRDLMKISGVGPKVADCVLLLAYHRLEVFPVDVWIARAVSRHYLGGRPVKPDEARREGERRYGGLAGYAQEYLFYWIRNTSA